MLAILYTVSLILHIHQELPQALAIVSYFQLWLAGIVLLQLHDLWTA
jgi:hypothetical protein